VSFGGFVVMIFRLFVTSLFDGLCYVLVTLSTLIHNAHYCYACISHHQQHVLCVCSAALSLAATDPLPYFSLIDCYSRCSLDAVGLVVAAQLLQQGACQPPAAMLQLLARPAAVAALTSAVAGWVKAWAVGSKYSAAFLASSSSSSAAAAPTSHAMDMRWNANGTDTAESSMANQAGMSASPSQQQQKEGYAAVLPEHFAHVAADLLLPIATNVCNALHNSSGSSSSQVTASARLLLVLVARLLVVLHDALEAAAAAAGVTPAELMAQSAALSCNQEASGSSVHSCFSAEQQQRLAHAASVRWQQYQGVIVEVVQQLWRAFGQAVKPPTQQQQQQREGGQNAVTWPHLLQLHALPKLLAAAEQLQSKWAASYLQLALEGSSSSITWQEASFLTQEQQQQQHQDASVRIAELADDALTFFRVLAAAVLPEVCNNPSCECL
jgi:hypothetical protein